MVTIAPLVRQRPDAVFVLRAGLGAVDDRESAMAAGRRAARLLFGHAMHSTAKRRIVIKPNITTSAEIDPHTGAPFPGQDGVVTSPWFVAGLVDGLRTLDDAPIAVAEGTTATALRTRGYERLMAERGVEFISLSLPRFTATHYPSEGLNWYHINGVVFRDLPFVRPFGDSDVFLINLPKMKAHNLAVTTLSVKNLQGAVALGYFRNFCAGVGELDAMPARVRAHFQADAREHVRALWKGHVVAGYKRWDLQGLSDEGYAQRAIDALDGAQPDLHIIEGCTIRDGTGFRRGKDLLGNYIVAGLNSIRVDSIATWLMGHDPCNIGLYRIGKERGKGENDPARIPVFLATELEFAPVDVRDLTRVPAGVLRSDGDSALVFY